MFTTLRAKFDYFRYKHSNYATLPSQRLVRYCFERDQSSSIASIIDEISHIYAYGDSDIGENLKFINVLYGPYTRERLRQILAKFVRVHYRV